MVQMVLGVCRRNSLPSKDAVDDLAELELVRGNCFEGAGIMKHGLSLMRPSA